MTPPIVHPLDVSFVLAVTAAAIAGAASGIAWLPLVVGAGYYALNQWLVIRAEQRREKTP